jgi:hypothetical protein
MRISKSSKGVTAMERSIHYLEEDGIVFAKTQGYSTWGPYKMFAEAMLELGRKKGVHKFLVDYRDMVLGLSVLEIDDLPKMFKGIGLCPEDKTAILYDPSAPHSSGFTFLENVSRLSSLRFKIFSDKDKAISWLKSTAADKSDP